MNKQNERKKFVFLREKSVFEKRKTFCDELVFY